MKIPASRHQHGFTLIELLVVIAIIAVLASIGFGVGNMAIQKAKKTKCLAVCTALEGAVNNFFTDYGSMPSAATSDVTVVTNTGDGVTLVKVLMGMETTTPVLNTRSVKYLDVKEGKSNKDGLIYSTDGSTITGLYDPWGGGYNVILDCDYNGIVKPLRSCGVQDNAATNGLHRIVAAWSNGADAAATGTGGKANDDVTTW